MTKKITMTMSSMSQTMTRTGVYVDIAKIIYVAEDVHEKVAYVADDNNKKEIDNDKVVYNIDIAYVALGDNDKKCVICMSQKTTLTKFYTILM